MRGLVPAAALLLTACGGPTVMVRYDPPAGAPVTLLPPGLPTVLVEDVDDRAGHGNLYGPVDANTGVNWAEVVADALPQELTRLGWPMAQNSQLARARLKATVLRAEAKWNAGFGVQVDGKVRIGLALKETTGREVWEGEVSGSGTGVAGGGGVAANAIRIAWKAALQDAMSRLGGLLDTQRPWELLGKTVPAAAAAAPVAAARAASVPVVSDLDELPAALAPRPHSYAVVIGVEHYRERLPDADFSAGDARLAARYFERSLGVPGENLVLLTDEHAAKSDFEKYFERWLPNRVEAGDLVYVYYSGHGAPNPAKGDSYLVPYDGDPTYIDQTGFPVQRLFDDLAKLPAKQVYVAMDSCFSGAGGRSVIAKGARPLVTTVSADVPARVTVLSASAGDQISNSYQEKGHGLFTYFFLKGLKEKGGDFKAAFDYLKPEVAKVAHRAYNADQTPQWREGR